MSKELWARYREHLNVNEAIGVTVDISRMNFAPDFLAKMEAPMQRAFAAMDALEAGAIANPDEQRMVGHYWLRAPERAPAPEIAAEIRATVAAIKRFAADVHAGTIRPPAASAERQRRRHRHRQRQRQRQRERRRQRQRQRSRSRIQNRIRTRLAPGRPPARRRSG